jgi:hypothetical protein
MSELTVPTPGNPKAADPVRMIDGYKDRLSEKTTLVATTSKTLDELMTGSIADADVGVTIISDGTVQYNPTAAADADSGFLPTVYSIHGGKAFLDKVELYAAGEVVVSIIVFECHNA